MIKLVPYGYLPESLGLLKACPSDTISFKVLCQLLIHVSVVSVANIDNTIYLKVAYIVGIALKIACVFIHSYIFTATQGNLITILMLTKTKISPRELKATITKPIQGGPRTGLKQAILICHLRPVSM